jgi:2-polyprenyl-3-methyl-5-hydroxy-6-metoxy-1,4-benzoquinol methylase
VQPESHQASKELFEAAQEKYYGETSVLVVTELGAFEHEIAAQRQRTLTHHLQERSTVLEAGPGSGNVLKWLVSQGHQPTAVEHSPTLAARLAAIFSIPVLVGEFECLEIDPARYDAVCSFHVIEHVSDPLEHLRAAYRAVKPGGLCFVATPNGRSLQQIVAPSLSPNFDSAHVSVFSPQSLRLLSQQAGWVLVEKLTPEYTSAWLRVVTKALRLVRNEDEEETAGKYASQESRLVSIVTQTLSIVSFPLRKMQAFAGYGNEVFFVLRKPDSTPAL